MLIDPKQQTHKDVYKLLIGSVVPRPIALVSSLSPGGVPNLAPFSFFNAVCSNPPIVLFSTGVRGDGHFKDTLRNIEATKEFVINIVSEDFTVQMNRCSEDFPPDVNEFEVSGLTPAPASMVRPALVKESRIQLECRLVQVVHFGEGKPGSGSTIFGEVLLFHVADGVINNFRIDPKVLKPVGRMGGPQYCRATDIFDLPRPGPIQG
ncbi:MAG TPA: flavin reductase family protein [Bacteroidota bacterium]|nr:flavin reductase family protein [Bacteroidota bacterium]